MTRIDPYQRAQSLRRRRCARFLMGGMRRVTMTKPWLWPHALPVPDG